MKICVVQFAYMNLKYLTHYLSQSIDLTMVGIYLYEHN